MNQQIRTFIEMLKATIPADAPKMWQLTPAQAREQSERFFAPFNAGGPGMAEVRDLPVAGRRRGIWSRLHVRATPRRRHPGCCTCMAAGS